MPADNIPAPDRAARTSLLVAVLVFCVAYNSTLQHLLNHWLAFDGNQSHGLLVIALVGYLSLRLLRACLPLRPQPSMVALAALLLLSLVWYVAAVANIDIAEQLLLPPLLALLVFTLLGADYARAFTPVFGLLFFAIPVWDYLVPTLVDLSAAVVGDLVSLSRIPALIEGNSFYLPDGKVDIVGGCSGVKYLTISLLIAYYILLTSKTTLRGKVVLLVVAAGLSIVMNWVRIFVIILVAYFSKMQSSLVTDHETFGWILFVLVIIPLVLYSRKLPVEPIERRCPDRQAATPVAARRVYALLIAACLVLSAAPLLRMSVHLSLPQTAPQQTLAGIPDLAVETRDGQKLLTIPHAREFRVFALQVNGQELLVETARHWRTAPEQKLVPYIASLYDRSHWSLKADQRIQLDGGAYTSSVVLQKKPYGDIQYVVYWYTVGGYRTSNYSTAKLLQIPAIIFGNNTFRLTAVRASCTQPDCRDAKPGVESLARNVYAAEMR